MRNAPRAQGALVAAQGGDGVFGVHFKYIALFGSVEKYSAGSR